MKRRQFICIVPGFAFYVLGIKGKENAEITNSSRSTKVWKHISTSLDWESIEWYNIKKSMILRFEDDSKLYMTTSNTYTNKIGVLTVEVEEVDVYNIMILPTVGHGWDKRRKKWCGKIKKKYDK